MIFTQIRNSRVVERFERNHPQRTSINMNKHLPKPYFDNAYHQNMSPPHFSTNQRKFQTSSPQKGVNILPPSRKKVANEESFNLSFQSKYSQSINSTQIKAFKEVKDISNHNIEATFSPQKTRGYSYSKKKSHYLTVVSRLPQFKSITKVNNYL